MLSLSKHEDWAPVRGARNSLDAAAFNIWHGGTVSARLEFTHGDIYVREN